MSLPRLDYIGNNSVGVSAAQENTSSNWFFISEVDGNGSVFCQIAVLGLSADQFSGSAVTFLEKIRIWRKAVRVYVKKLPGRRLRRLRRITCPFG